MFRLVLTTKLGVGGDPQYAITRINDRRPLEYWTSRKWGLRRVAILNRKHAASQQGN